MTNPPEFRPILMIKPGGMLVRDKYLYIEELIKTAEEGSGLWKLTQELARQIHLQHQGRDSNTNWFAAQEALAYYLTETGKDKNFLYLESDIAKEITDIAIKILDAIPSAERTINSWVESQKQARTGLATKIKTYLDAGRFVYEPSH